MSMKARAPKKASNKLRHEPIGDGRGKGRKMSAVHDRKSHGDEDDSDEEGFAERNLPISVSSTILRDARALREEGKVSDYDDDEGENEGGDLSGEEDDDDQVDSELVYVEGDGIGLSGGEQQSLDEAEEGLIAKFMQADKAQSRTLADIILEKLREKEIESSQLDVVAGDEAPSIPPKVVEVYTAVGNMLTHYKSGKLPKALKMLPHLKNWEQILWLTRPDMWSPIATYAVTRIFVSNLKVKMAQRFFNLVLLEKVRDDIQSHQKLNYHLYLALKKALFKPAAFYKGVFLPLAQSGTCTLREAIIVGSVLMKVSIPAIHSAAALLRLAEMPYSGSTSVFIKILLMKKYALPGRVLDALVEHFAAFSTEKRALPVIWHQALLIFVQRYKMELSEAQSETILQLVKVQSHHEISPEVRRELAGAKLR